MGLRAALDEERERNANLEALDEKRHTALEYARSYREQNVKAYEKAVKPREFKVGDKVLRLTQPQRAGLPVPKFTPKWEGPFVVIEAHGNGYYYLEEIATGRREAPINVKF